MNAREFNDFFKRYCEENHLNFDVRFEVGTVKDVWYDNLPHDEGGFILGGYKSKWVSEELSFREIVVEDNHLVVRFDKL